MKKIKSCDSHSCYSENIDKILLDDDISFSKILNCETCASKFHETVEAIHGTFSGLEDNYVSKIVNSSYDKFNEDLDLSRLEQNTKNKPLPGYLKKFLKNAEPVKTENTTILCVISDSLKVFDVLSRGLRESFLQPIPSFRGTDTALKYKVMEEDCEEIKFSYQFIKESDDLVYLAIQVFPKSENKYQDVELTLDNRLLISSKINEMGIVNFPNLQEGKYKLNFSGKNLLKSVDLTIYTE